MELTNPVADPRIVDKLAEWLLEKKPWAYTGHKSTRSNAKPKELWVRFHKDTEVWWFEHFRYSTEPATDAGAKGPAYSLFRDALPDALRLFLARKEGKPLEEIPPVEYLYRKGESTKDGAPAERPCAPSKASADSRRMCRVPPAQPMFLMRWERLATALTPMSRPSSAPIWTDARPMRPRARGWSRTTVSSTLRKRSPTLREPSALITASVALGSRDTLMRGGLT